MEDQTRCAQLHGWGVPPLSKAIALLLALAACQADGAEPADRLAAEAGPSTEPAADQAAGVGQSQVDGPRLRVGEILSVTAAITGARDTIYEGSTAEGNVEPGGGCRSDQILKMGFTFIAPEHVSESWVRWDVGSPMEPGATGTFDVEWVAYWYPGLGLPSRNTFEGSGSLEITRHDAGRTGGRRMAGRLIATGLQDIDGNGVDVDVSFDMGGSCGMID